MLQAQGDLTGAIKEFQAELTIATQLAAKEPEKTGWQEDLFVSHNRIGGVLEAQGDLAGALKEFEAELTTTTQLAEEFGEHRLAARGCGRP